MWKLIIYIIGFFLLAACIYSAIDISDKTFSLVSGASIGTLMFCLGGIGFLEEFKK